MQLAHQIMKAAAEVSFSVLSPGRQNDSLYFAEQTGGKQHMPLLTELQNQNWQILEEEATIIKPGTTANATLTSSADTCCCCSTAPEAQVTLLWIPRQAKKVNDNFVIKQEKRDWHRRLATIVGFVPW